MRLLRQYQLVPLLSLPLLAGCDPGINALEPWNGTPHYAAASMFPGTNLEIRGTKMCDAHTMVTFGGAAPVPLDSCDAGGNTAHMRVGRLASTGLVTLTPGDGSGPFSSPSAFTVNTMRNQHGFKFPNYNGPRALNVGDFAELYGADQFLVGIDICAPFGGHCPIRLPVPDPIAFIYVGAWMGALGGKGECFGMVLGSQRLMRGDVPLSRFDAAATNVWQLDTPASPPSLPGLEHFLDLQHISQASGEYLGAYVRGATANAVLGDGAAASVRTRVTSALSQSPPNFPMIALRKGGGGHLLVAYDVEDGTAANGGNGDGDYFIYVYDPNQPFLESENGDPMQHTTREQNNSRIHVLHGNHWDFIGNFADSPWGGDMSALVVTSYGDVPMVHPTLPSITDLAGTLVFASGPVVTTQVTDDKGHSLFDAKGNLNPEADKALPDAAAVPMLTGSDAGETLVLGKAGVYTQRLLGSGKGGVFTTRSVSKGFAAVVQASSAGEQSSQNTEVTFDTAGGSVLYKPASDQKLAALQILGRAKEGTTRSARVRIDSAAGQEELLTIDAARQVITFQHSGPDAALEIVLAFTGEGAAPGIFAPTQSLPVKQGDTVTIAPTDWTKLGGAPVKITVHHANGGDDMVSLDPGTPVTVTKGPDSKGTLELKVEASTPGVVPLVSVDVSCSGDPEAWVSLGMLSGIDPQTVTGTFNVHDEKAGCGTITAGEHPIFLRLAEDNGGYPFITAVNVQVP